MRQCVVTVAVAMATHISPVRGADGGPIASWATDLALCTHVVLSFFLRCVFLAAIALCLCIPHTMQANRQLPFMVEN
jgi:hypothetical protein